MREQPLSSDELAVRYRALCDDPCLVKVPGKIELDVWGRLLMTPPPSVYHGRVQAINEAPIVTAAGVYIADVAWASPSFMSAHGSESPSNSVKELTEKREAYLVVGAEEVWIVFPKSKRCEFYARQGRLPASPAVALAASRRPLTPCRK